MRPRRAPHAVACRAFAALAAILAAPTACAPVAPSTRDAAADVAIAPPRDTPLVPDVQPGADAPPPTPDAVAAIDATGDASDAATPPPDAPPAGTPVVVVVGYGARRVRSTDGRSWTDFAQINPSGGDDDDLFRGGAFIDGEFVAVGGAARGIVMTSRDGRAWSMASRTAPAWIGGVAGLGGALVAAGGNGLRARSRDHGASWIDSAGYQAIHYRSVAGNGTVVVAAGHTYGGSPDVGVIATTRDGVSWTEALRGGATLHSVAFGNGVFVAAGNNARVVVSSDAARWTDRTGLEGSESYRVVFANGAFYASGGGRVYRSSDGAAWTRVEGASREIAGGFNGRLLSLGWPATIESSPDARTWERVFAPGGSGLTTVMVGTVP